MFSPAIQVLGIIQSHFSGKPFTEPGCFRFTFLALSELAPDNFLPTLPGRPLFLEIERQLYALAVAEAIHFYRLRNLN